MSDKRIEAAAGVAMAEWESLFSSLLLGNAKALAAQSKSDVVTLDHLREAAGPTIETLLATIKGEQKTDGQRKVA